ncbi:MAG: DUF177 domain-containing protein [Oscillospiraceae bacterium]|nr:DUF177 domain-containing protein [Oscillospiraceae bacterium]
MIINLRKIFNLPGEVMPVDVAIDQHEITDIHGYNFASPVVIKGQAYNRAGIVKIKFTTEFTLNLICDRCLKEFERPYVYEFEHVVVKSLSTENDEYIVADNESIDLKEIAISDLLLQLPSKILCDEDCKGLCFSCGCNLNESQCDCFSS